MPCVEDCSWYCLHRRRCPLPCAVPCDLLPCSERYAKMLACGIGVCLFVGKSPSGNPPILPPAARFASAPDAESGLAISRYPTSQAAISAVP